MANNKVTIYGNPGAYLCPEAREPSGRGGIARLIDEEHDRRVDSAPRGTLARLDQTARELEGIENSLRLTQSKT